MSTQRPILFSGPMVRAILNGTKTQTRRIVKPQPDENGLSFMKNAPLDWREDIHGPWLQWKGETPGGDTWDGPTPYFPGLRLWVKETHRFPDWDRIEFQADGTTHHVQDNAEVLLERNIGLKWRPSIFMWRWASRINLEVIAVRVERLQDISEEDAIAEGIEQFGPGCWRNYDIGGKSTLSSWDSPSASYMSLWESINSPGSWDANPFVWVVTFNKFIPQT